jgi:hypothetical protein
MGGHLSPSEIKSDNLYRRIYDSYASAIAYICVVDSRGDQQVGTCFHIGEGVFITARHVVEGFSIKEIGTTVSQRKYYERPDTSTSGFASVEIPYFPTVTDRFQGPFFHPDKQIDVAALVIPGLQAPIIPLGDHLDDWLGDELILSTAIVFGYPTIPFSRGPLLISAKCEINAIVDKYTGGHPHFIMSTMARGGFSGGPAITESGFTLGVVTESLTSNHQPVELGYLSVLSVEAIYNCISHHRIIPEHIDRQWDGFWNKEYADFYDGPSNHISIGLYRGKGNFYFDIFSYNNDVITQAIQILNDKTTCIYSITWRHDKMIKVEFRNGSIDEELATDLYTSIVGMVDKLGLKRLGA